MNWKTAEAITAELEKTSLHGLRDELVEKAVKYARIRVDWQLADRARRVEMEHARTAAHNALIDACNILSRNMVKEGESIRWREGLGGDRKEIGDFAAFLHAILGVRAR